MGGQLFSYLVIQILYYYYYHPMYIIDCKYTMIDKKKYVLFIDLHRKVYPDLQKEKVIQRWAGIMVKSSYYQINL